MSWLLFCCWTTIPCQKQLTEERAMAHSFRGTQSVTERKDWSHSKSVSKQRTDRKWNLAMKLNSWLQLGPSSRQATTPKGSTASPNSPTNWGPDVQTREPVGDTSHAGCNRCEQPQHTWLKYFPKVSNLEISLLRLYTIQIARNSPGNLSRRMSVNKKSKQKDVQQERTD